MGKVDVIRCKDCKYYTVKDHWYDKSIIPVLGTSDCPTCMKWGSGDGCMTRPNGYCFLAEKKSKDVDKESPRVLTYEEAIEAQYFVMEVRGRPYVSGNGRAHVFPGELHQFVHEPGKRGWFSPSLNDCNQPYFDRLMSKGEYDRFIRCWDKLPSKEDCEKHKWTYEMGEDDYLKNCVNCKNSFVDEDDKLHCMADGHDHEKTVEDDDFCEDFC